MALFAFVRDVNQIIFVRRTGEGAVHHSPESRRLICGPRQHGRLFPGTSADPDTIGIEPVRQVLQTGGALKDDDFPLGLGVLVLQGRDVTLRVDAVVGLLSGVDDGQYVGELELLGQNERFDVVDVVCLVGFARSPVRFRICPKLSTAGIVVSHL